MWIVIAKNFTPFDAVERKTFMGEDHTEVSTNKTRTRVFVSRELKAKVFFVRNLVAWPWLLHG